MLSSLGFPIQPNVNVTAWGGGAACCRGLARIVCLNSLVLVVTWRLLTLTYTYMYIFLSALDMSTSREHGRTLYSGLPPDARNSVRDASLILQMNPFKQLYFWICHCRMQLIISACFTRLCLDLVFHGWVSSSLIRRGLLLVRRGAVSFNLTM